MKCDSVSGRILKYCILILDSRCECLNNKYWNSDILRCKECIKCNLGEEVIFFCKINEDIKCEKCLEVGRNLIFYCY